MGPKGCPEMSANQQPTPRNVTEEQRRQLNLFLHTKPVESALTSSSAIPLLYAHRARSGGSQYSSRGCISRILLDKSSRAQSMETFNLTAFVILLPTPQFGLETKGCRRQRKSRPFRGLAQKESVGSEHHCRGTKSHCAGGKLCEWDFDQRQLSAFLNTYSCFQNVFRTSLYKTCTQTVDMSDRNESQS
jgi:hypothetical protein